MSALVSHVSRLRVSQGEGAGQPFRVLPWQARFLRSLERVEGIAALSVARGNGKSTLCAALASAYLWGPLRQPRAEVVIVAASFAQARIIFEHVLGFLGGGSRRLFRVRDSANAALIEAPDGARVRCASSDPGRLLGLAPALVLADEPAAWPGEDGGQGDRMFAALQTSLGKVPGSRLIALGTRPARSDHWFAQLLAGAAAVAQVHAVEGEGDLTLKTARRANPSMDAFPALRAQIQAEAKLAKADPALLAQYRAYRLNAGVTEVAESLLLDAGTWERVEGDAQRAGAWVLGLDLGGSAAMSAACAYWPSTGRLEALAAFAELPSLRERGMRDGVGGRYVSMFERGELILAGRHVCDVSRLLAAALERWGTPAAIVADTYRAAELRQALDAASAPPCELVVRRQGFLDGGQDVRAFQRAVGSGAVVPVQSLLLRSALAEARTVSDAAGNRKLAKQTQGGRRALARDDAAAASILAVAVGYRHVRAAAPAPQHAICT